MQQEIFDAIVNELRRALAGGILGKIYQLTHTSFALDFRRRDSGFLFIDSNPALPRIYLIRSSTRELEKQSISLSEFGQALRVNLSGGILKSIQQDEGERIVRLPFGRVEETGETRQAILVAQLTGRSANLLLLDKNGEITHTQRSLTGLGQSVGEIYQPPIVRRRSSPDRPFEQGDFESLSAAADHYYQELAAAQAFKNDCTKARNILRHEVSRLLKLQKHLTDDLAAHGDPEKHKRLGDLLLANISAAKRNGNKLTLTDFYAPGLPTVEIEIDDKTSLQKEAARYFALYGKARRAAQQIAERLDEVQNNLSALYQRQAHLEQVIADHDEHGLAQVLKNSEAGKKEVVAPGKGKTAEKIPGVRRYVSGDGFEILVGRAAKDNDYLTFRVARSHDLWLHAADYPGSHVLVRNPGRKEIPHRTIIEAAQLAAKFSQAGKDSKVNVHYTPQKYVSRIKGAAPGLVRLASFRTLTAEPKEAVERI